MTWISEGSHMCNLPYEDDVPVNSVWQCPTCRQNWQVTGYSNWTNTNPVDIGTTDRAEALVVSVRHRLFFQPAIAISRPYKP